MGRSSYYQKEKNCHLVKKGRGGVREGDTSTGVRAVEKGGNERKTRKGKRDRAGGQVTKGSDKVKTTSSQSQKRSGWGA